MTAGNLSTSGLWAVIDRPYSYGTLRTAVRTRGFSAASVQAMTTSFPDRAIRGNPPDRAPGEPDAVMEEPGVPRASIWRRRTWLPWLERSIQLATAPPDGRLTTPTRPVGFPSSMRIALPNVLPESPDIRTLTRGFSPAAVNQATATLRPLDEIAGPLIGQPSISQPSFVSGSGGDQRLLAYRTMEI